MNSTSLTPTRTSAPLRSRRPESSEITFVRGRSLRSQVEASGLSDRLSQILEATGLTNPELAPTRPITLLVRGRDRFELVVEPKRTLPPAALEAPEVTHRCEHALRRTDSVEVRMLLLSNQEGLAISEHRVAAGAEFRFAPCSTDRRFILPRGGVVTIEGARLEAPEGSILRLPRGQAVVLSGLGDEPLTTYELRTSKSPLPSRTALLELDESQSFLKRVEGCELNVVSNRDDDPRISIVRACVAPGSATNPHAVRVTERYLITSGEGVAVIGGKRTQVRAGDLVSIPPMVPQWIENTGTGVLEFSAICTPRFQKRDYQDLTPPGDARSDARAARPE